ncbi:MmcQ/YjbR family DNA-binding protein [Hymenobacter sp. ASUV-10]|uniref:MmcQ/YjbR family DNA-binding protein n=1 Tax=Hymenobacter aranciens TaxID=3063996 RepID=A0ABT9B905_9BACT|nr:MmcQ/YjbR family DNA-binding protein [Hymenobacter sp. ASUV-10]MDO7874668.1 MmcQ/YjbR family DNA-binding protein [Hymenobacter sp. ASUV-10]
MAVSYHRIWEAALGFPGVSESLCHGTPALFVGKKLLARLLENGETLMLKVPLDQREQYFEEGPDTFFITSHYQNYAGLLIDLPSVRWEMLPPMLENAWRMVAPRKLITAYEAARA